MILDNSPDLVSTHDGETGFLYVSDSCRTLLGYTPEEILGRSLLSFVHEEDLACLGPVLRRLRAGLDQETTTCRYRRKDGTYVWVEPTIHVQRRGERGEVDLAVTVSRDVSERRAAEERQADLRQALAAAAVEWKSTFDAIRSPLLVVEPDGGIVRVNQAARDLLGPFVPAADADLLGRPLLAVGHGEPWAGAAALVAGHAGAAGPESAEVRDGESGRCWHIELTPRGAEEPTTARLLLQLGDVTETVRLQESLRRSEVMATLGAVVAGLAHEVRNPLFGMSSVLDAFESRFGDRPEYQRHLGRLRAELERIKKLMQALLTHGRPVRPKLEQGCLRSAVEEAMLLCRPAAQRHRVALTADLAVPWLPIALDRERMVLAVKNVIDNAVQHSPAGGGVHVVSGRVEVDGATWLKLEIEDSGPGFPEGELTRVFQPFVSHRPGGTGLGLAVVAQAVEDHGGQVRAYNRANGGVIEILVPAPAAEAA